MNQDKVLKILLTLVIFLIVLLCCVVGYFYLNEKEFKKAKHIQKAEKQMTKAEAFKERFN